jgi:hypothetical protein
VREEEKVERNWQDGYLEYLNLVFCLSKFFMVIQEHDRVRRREANPSARVGYINPKFEPTFQRLCKLLHHSESRTLNIRPLAKLMNEFSEMLISSGIYRPEELSAFWAMMDEPQKIALHSLRFKKAGASTLSSIVADADRAQERPSRPGSQRPKADRPTVPKL